MTCLQVDWCGKYKRKFYVSLVKCKLFSVFRLTLVVKIDAVIKQK